MKTEKRSSQYLLTIFFVLATANIFAGRVKADTGVPSVSTDLTVSTKYVWRGLLITDDPVLQPSLTVDHKKLSINLWANHDLTDRGLSGASEITEVDYTLDYSYSINDFSLSWGIIQYTFPNTGSEGTTELYGSFSYDFALTPTLSLYYDTDEAGGVYGNLALTWGLAIPEVAGISPSLDLSGSIGYATDNWNRFYYGVDDSTLVDLLLTASLSVPFDDYLSIVPFASFSFLVDGKLEDAAEAAGSNGNPVFIGARLSIAF